MPRTCVVSFTGLDGVRYTEGVQDATSLFAAVREATTHYRNRSCWNARGIIDVSDGENQWRVLAQHVSAWGAVDTRNRFRQKWMEENPGRVPPGTE